MSEFIPGLELGRLFYQEIVSPLWKRSFPSIPHSAALIGSGSEVLGFDTAQSTDHHWGPRVMIFLSEDDHEQYHEEISTFFSEQLPYTFRGFSTNFGSPDEVGVQLLKEIDAGPINHRVKLFILQKFFQDCLGIDPYKDISVVDWLTFPEQRLLEITGGKVYHDGLGQLQGICEKFRYYPDEVWRYLLAAQWKRISEEEAFVGRCGDVGDELGSHIIATRIVRELMRLCLLMERKYVPYNKWFGTAFSRLDCAAILNPIFMQVLHADSWKERETHLAAAYGYIAGMHNALQLTKPMETRASRYYGRPYLVIQAEHFAKEILETVQDDELRKLEYPIGSVDQWTDNTKVVSDPKMFRRLAMIYNC